MSTTLRDLPTSYREAEAFLAGADQRACGNNTVVVRYAVGGGVPEYSIVLHNTEVVCFVSPHSGGHAGVIKVRTGGHNTVTTQARINRVIHCHNKHLSRRGGKVRLESYSGTTRWSVAAKVELAYW